MTHKTLWPSLADQETDEKYQWPMDMKNIAIHQHYKMERPTFISYKQSMATSTLMDMINVFRQDVENHWAKQDKAQ